jgi:hypothetical protein
MRSSTEVAQRLTVQHRFKFALSVTSDTDRLKIANGAGQETAGGFDLSVQQRPRKIAAFLIFTEWKLSSIKDTTLSKNALAVLRVEPS